MAARQRTAKQRGTFSITKTSKKDEGHPAAYSEPCSDFIVERGREPGLRTPAEAIEARLERKAAEADGKVFATESLGQLSYKERDKLLFGE